MGHFEAKIYLKDNNIEERANDLLKEKKHPRVLGETESYLKSRGIERPPVTQQQTNDNDSQTAETEKRGMGVGGKIFMTIIVLFVGSVIMGLIKEAQGFGILHGLAGIGTVCGLFLVWKK